MATSGRSLLGDDDAHWLRVADLLERAARQRRRMSRARGRGNGRSAISMARAVRTENVSADPGGDEDGAFASLRDALCEALVPRSMPERSSAPRAGGPTGARTPLDAGADAAVATALLDAVAAIAERMEVAGALTLAASVLGLGCEALPNAAVATHAFAAVLRARVARKRGDLAYADDLYAAAVRLGRDGAAPAVVAQATLGRGVVARMRGDYPSARRAFEVGVRLARSAGRRDLESVGHQGLLVAAATAEDFETALAHGWAALELARGNAEAEADALANLAAVAGDMGDHRAAVRGYLAAATRTRAPRLRVPVLGGAAVSAAALGNGQLVRRLEALLTTDLDTAQLPYETATGWTLLARAWRHLGDESGALRREAQARALADRHGFHELSHLLESDAVCVRPPRTWPGSEATSAVPNRRTAGLLDRLARLTLGPEWAADAPLVTR